ncbi:MAG: cytochrome c-550 PedF [Beijerinckiaceae bacterium]
MAAASQVATGHGNVTPQPVDTTGLPNLGPEWKTSNPFRVNPRAIEIGEAGFGQNCARCHGLQMISGGLAPDLRKLEKGDEGDAIFIERVTHGAVINDVTKMPPFAGVLSQEALWAIRAYIESNHQE